MTKISGCLTPHLVVYTIRKYKKILMIRAFFATNNEKRIHLNNEWPEAITRLLSTAIVEYHVGFTLALQTEFGLTSF